MINPKKSKVQVLIQEMPNKRNKTRTGDNHRALREISPHILAIIENTSGEIKFLDVDSSKIIGIK